MQRMMDKHLIYVTCLLLLLPGNKGYEPVLTLLASLTIMEISMLFSHKWVRYGILAFFCVCCLIFQPLTFFLPIFLYDLAMEGEWWGYVSLALFFVNQNNFREYWQMGLWWRRNGFKSFIPSLTIATSLERPISTAAMILRM